MKKRLIILGILICIFLFFSIVVLSNDIKYDFRKTNWGMSEQEVKASENREILEIYQDGFAYKDKISGLNCNTVYQFTESKLYIAGYIFTELYTNYDRWIDDYHQLKSLLTKKYGESVKSGEFWSSETHKDMWSDGQNLGTAVGMGYLVYYTEWDTPKTKIWIGLKGDSFEVDLRIIYESKELEEWVKQIKEKEALKEF